MRVARARRMSLPCDDRHRARGCTASYVGARIAFNRGQRFFADASLEVPVRVRTADLSVTPDYRLRVSFSWRR